MPNIDRRVDDYINKSKEFAKPILNHLRMLVHKACPEITETIKWGMPYFDYKGLVCAMASFKEHCSFGFWKGPLLKDRYNVLSTDEGMGHFGKIKNLDDLPSDKIILSYLIEAVKLNEEGVSVPRKKLSEKKELEIPGYFLEALKNNDKAIKTFENFSYANKKEYVEWVTEAKTESTREKRLKTAVEWMAEGKIRNWKYMKK